MYTPSPHHENRRKMAAAAGQPSSPEDHARTMLAMEELEDAIGRAREECFGDGAALPQVAEVIHAYFKLRGDTQEERLSESEVARLGRQMQVPSNYSDVIRKVYSLVRLENEASACEESHLEQLDAERARSSRKAPRSARSAPSPSARSAPSPAYSAPPTSALRRRQPAASPNRLGSRSATKTPMSVDRARAAYTKGPKPPRRDSTVARAEALLHSDDTKQRRQEEARERRNRDDAVRQAKLEEAQARRDQREAERKLAAAAARRAKTEESQFLKEEALAKFEEVEQQATRRPRGPASGTPATGGRPGSAQRRKSAGSPKARKGSPSPSRRTRSPAAAAAAEQQARDEAMWAHAKQTALEKRQRREEQALREQQQRRSSAIPIVSPAHGVASPRPPEAYMGPRSRSPVRAHNIGEERVSLLFRDHGKLGISFNGPVRGPAIVTGIVPDSVAAKSRSLKVGMVLSEVAGVSVEGLAFSDALNRIEHSGRPLALCFRQPTDKEVRAHQEHELRQEAAVMKTQSTSSSPLQSNGVSGVSGGVSMSPAEISDLIDSALAETGGSEDSIQVSREELHQAFRAFAAWGKGAASPASSRDSASKTWLSAVQFSKLCRDCGIVDPDGAGRGGEVSRADVDLVFSRLVSKGNKGRGSRGLSFPQFEGALEILSLRRFGDIDPEVAYRKITDFVVSTAGPQNSPQRSSPDGDSDGKASPLQRDLVSRLEDEFGGEATEEAQERDYGMEGTPSKYGTPREIPELDADETDGQHVMEQTAYEDASMGDNEQPHRNVAQISREILDSIFRAIGDAMRHHRTVFNHDLETTRSAFSAFDRDDSGEINLPEFEAAMRRLDIPLSDEQLRQIFETFDANDNGTIEYMEFAEELHRHGEAADEIEAEGTSQLQENEQGAQMQHVGEAEENEGGMEDQRTYMQYNDEAEEEEDEMQVVGTGKITYEIDDDEELEESDEAVEESFRNLTMGVIVEEPMEEIEEITPSPRPSPAGNSSDAEPQQSADGAHDVADSSMLRDTEADLQHFVEEWRTLDVQQTNALSLKELAILLQRLPVPMGVGEHGGAEELGELMTQLLASQEVPVVNGAVGFREVGLWMVKQLTAFSQQREQAEVATAGTDTGAEAAETDDQYDNDGYGDDGGSEAPDGLPSDGHAESSRPSPLLSPPPSPSRVPAGVRGPSPSPSKTSNSPMQSPSRSSSGDAGPVSVFAPKDEWARLCGTIDKGGGNALERAVFGMADEMRDDIMQTRREMTELREGMEIVHDSVRQLYELLGPVIGKQQQQQH